ncbi:hypothetical protein M422DRAFT_62623 [Sphaerobolus stellatus SS14]|nr:hypothetical protein M422DRAFT_62623 [Sphaerobolus stellatus SS14]
MHTFFARLRLYTYIILIIFSAVVLGLAADLASKFINTSRADYSIFSIVVSALSILVLIFILLRSQPRVDLWVAFIIGVLWLSLAAWSVDIVGNVQCVDLVGQTLNTTQGAKTSAAAWCREMKAIEAISWAIFASLAIAFILLIALATRAQSIGMHNAWARSISDLPWWGENEAGEPYYTGGGHGSEGYGSYNGNPAAAYNANAAYNAAALAYPGAQIVQQQPGHSVVIQPGPGGPRVQQVPGSLMGA